MYINQFQIFVSVLYRYKVMDEIPRDDWMEQLKSLHITRVDMNKLIMNYLVTGKLFI